MQDCSLEGFEKELGIETPKRLPKGAKPKAAKQVDAGDAMKNGIPMISPSMAGHYLQTGLGQLKKLALAQAPSHLGRREKKQWLKQQAADREKQRQKRLKNV
jgi:hypothetical protein